MNLEEIEARANDATEGPWVVEPDPDYSYLDKVVRHYGHLTDLLARCFHANGNAEFIAHARQDIPALIAEVRRLQDECKRLKTLIELSNAMEDEMPGCRACVERHDKELIEKGANITELHEGYHLVQLERYNKIVDEYNALYDSLFPKGDNK